jgi:ribosome biogenesis GTPase
MEGIIVKGIAGFYYVKVDKVIIECKARGKFRHTELTPMVGDRVKIAMQGNKGVIESVNQRSSELIRPPVANVTQAYVIFTLKDPDLNLDLLNRFTMLCEYNNIEPKICFNKVDLVDMEQLKVTTEMFEKAGYHVYYLNAKEGLGLNELESMLEGNVTVLCGPSGVGKSTILNRLTGKELMKTGEISEKVGRGKHTTRHCELIEVYNGYIVDTPGFSSLSIDFITKDKLQLCFPEFHDYMNNCKFTGCMHYKEPSCAVKNAVEENIIAKERYDFYVKSLEEILNGRNKR